LSGELTRLDRDIAEMSAQDMRLQKELKDLSAKMQAAQHQRVLLFNTQQQQQRRGTPKPRSVLRRRPTSAPGGGARTAPPPPPYEKSRQGTPTAPRPPRQQPRGGRPGGRGRRTAPPPPPPDGAPRPEASSASVQDILLILGALLLAVAAVVFGVVAGGVLDSVSRAAILLVATVLTLAVPRTVARRGLIATAETVAAVGLLLVPLDGYTLWTIEQLGLRALPGTFVAGLVCAATVVVAAVYMTVSGLTVPRFAIVLAIQPVLPLLTYHWISGPAGWALVLATVAAVDATLGGMLGQVSQPGRTAAVQLSPDASAQSARDTAQSARDTSAPSAPSAREAPAADSGDEAGEASGPEAEMPAPPPSATQTQLAVAAATFWLRELTWVMHALALGGGLAYAVAALVTADTVPAALRAAATLLAAATVGVYGALQVRQRPLPDVAAGLMTLALIAAASRVAAVALPGRALVLIAAAVAVAGVGVRSLPEWARRGPQLASALALAVLGVVIAANALRTAVAVVRAALPMWRADLSEYPRRLADAVGPAEWQLVAAALLLTAAAYLALPASVRREGAVAGAAITALTAPASLGLTWTTTPWLLVTVAVAIGATGLSARTERAATTHTAAAGLVGLVGAGGALARPGLSALILTALTLAGVLIAVAERLIPPVNGGVTRVLGGWAAGGAAFALPGAVAAGVATATLSPTPILVVSYLAVCASLGYAAIDQVAHRQVSVPLAVGSGLAAVAVATAAFRTSDTAADTWVAALLLAGAVLLFLAPSIDATRRADRLLDGPDIAAGVITAATVAALARIGALVLPGSALATTAALVLIVALWVRALPEDWRRGPILGSAASGAVIAVAAGYIALRDGIRLLGLPGRIWAADLDAWPGNPGGDTNWQVPVALLLLAAAAAVVLPKPAAYDVAAAGVGLATVGAPIALGLPWWSPIAVGGAVFTGYGISSVLARDPRAGVARAVLATAVALHAAGASLVRPWTTAAALALIVAVGIMVATLAVLVARWDVGIVDDTVPGGTAHLPIIGGAAVTGALLALPGVFAAIAGELARPPEVVLTAALAAASIGLAVIATFRREVPQYLGYATAGVAGGATITAVAALPTDQPAGVYAAAAVLLGVIAELQRAESVGPDGRGGETSSWRSAFAATTGAPPPQGLFFSGLLSSGSHGAQRTVDGMVQVSDGMLRRWRIGPVRQLSISPIRGALAVSTLPTALALAMIVPALVTALVAPYDTLDSIWDGAPAALLQPTGGDPASVLAALLMTVAAALAAVGFSGGSPVQAIPVVLPGLAVTLLITPVALGAAWPASTMACLTVFTISSLGVALTPPPPDTDQTRPVRVARHVVFWIGLMAGGAGLVGSLATPGLTLFTLGGAVGVGAAAALGGRTQLARILGWLFAAASAQGLVLTLGFYLGLPARDSAFGVLGVGAVLLVMAATLPRLRRPEAYQETSTVEWSGHAAALLALALAITSPLHVAALLASWGAVLGLAATRPNRRPQERRALFWATVGCEIGAWWLLMRHTDVALIEAYTLPFAVLALLIGVLEARHRPDLSSWAAYGPALVAAFLPTLTIVLFSSTVAARQVALLLGAVAVLIAGSVRRQQAPVMVGAIVTAITALRLLTEYGPWLVLVPVGLTLLVLGANYEKRRRDIQRLRATLTSFR
jgi:hypothetical protein